METPKGWLILHKIVTYVFFFFSSTFDGFQALFQHYKFQAIFKAYFHSSTFPLLGLKSKHFSHLSCLCTPCSNAFSHWLSSYPEWFLNQYYYRPQIWISTSSTQNPLLFDNLLTQVNFHNLYRSLQVWWDQQICADALYWHKHTYWIINSLIPGRCGNNFILKGHREKSIHLASPWLWQSPPGGWFNVKMPSYQYRKSHCGDKRILRPSYLHNGISYTGKMASLYWIRAQDTVDATSVEEQTEQMLAT